jgi:hypothetical protein
VSSFITPKKDNTVCFISDFREVNKGPVRKPFPIPKISTLLQELEGFTFAIACAWATIPFDWILMHPKSAASFFHGGSILISGY